MPKVTMYCTAFCPYCLMAERLLNVKGIQQIEKIRVDLNPELRAEMIKQTRRRTVPQIYIDDLHVGGFTDLAALERRGELDSLLQR